MAPRIALLLGAVCLPLSGCVSMAGLQDCQYRHTQRKRAAASWRQCHTLEQRACLSSHYEAGYKAGFFDTATGRDCRVPPVAPPKYWAARYQCCEGRTCVEDWFRGYQCGIAAAQSKGYPPFHEVPVSVDAPTTNKTACGMCYACDPCECSLQNGPELPMTGLPAGLPVERTIPHPDTAPSISQPVETAHPIDDAAGHNVVIPAPQLGLIGGSGAENFTMIGPVDPKLLHKKTPQVITASAKLPSR